MSAFGRLAIGRSPCGDQPRAAAYAGSLDCTVFLEHGLHYRLGSTPPPHVGYRAIYPLIAIDRFGAWHPLGTAFLVARVDPHHAFLLTATHAIEEIERIDRRAWERPLPHLAGMGEVPFTRITELRDTRLAVVNLHRPFPSVAFHMNAWGMADQDITLIDAMIPPSADPWFPPPLPIDPSPVAVGTQLEAFGFPKMAVDYDDVPDVIGSTDRLTFYCEDDRRSGRVRQRCEPGDSIHKWPGYHVDFAFDSGMSGGPLIEMRDGTPTVRGVICSDVSDPQDLTRGTGAAAFGSEIWPSLALALGIGMTFGKPSAIPRLVDMFGLGIFDDRGDTLDHFSIEGPLPRQRVQWRRPLTAEEQAQDKGAHPDQMHIDGAIIDLGWFGRWLDLQ